MSRDLLFVGLVVLVGGTLAWLLPSVGAASSAGPAWRRERPAWRRVVAPLVAIAFGTALLVGWALEEPAHSDERLAPAAWALVAAVSLLWIRALARFVTSLLARPSEPLAVIGLVRPRIVIDPRFEASLDHAALGAALAHEAAHVAHRDPLRIALAQIATDLQWPWPAARRRLVAWRALLEETRDDEAVAAGSCPEDLAQAIVSALRFASPGRGAAIAGQPSIATRIERLLDGSARTRPPRSPWFAAVLLAALAAAVVVGVQLGDDLVGLLPGVLR